MGEQKNLYDVVVVGGGPAGLTSAIYLARARYRVLVIEKDQLGGQITITDEVDNYPGVGKISGRELTENMHRQAEKFGAEFLSATAKNLSTEGDIKTVHTDRGDYSCFGILLATGAHPRTVGFVGEEKYKGHGVAYCATCDGEFFTGKPVFVVGGGFAAAEESVFLTKFASHVTILIREEDFTCAEAVAENARSHEKISVLTNTIVEEVSGDHGLNYIRYKNIETGEVTEYRAEEGDTFGVFVFVGYAPETSLVKGIAALNEQGYVITDRSQKTSVEGLYAAGDVCIKPLRQVVTATGDGALAATELEKYVSRMQEKTGLFPMDMAKGQADTSDTTHGISVHVEDERFSPEIRAQLADVFERMAKGLMLKLYLDERPVSAELEEYMISLSSMTDKLSLQIADRNASSEIAPCVRICDADGNETGLAFHGVPGGHEFSSFILALYNAAGPGQTIDEDVKRSIASIDRTVEIKVLVTLSCGMCPDLVAAVQRIASLNPHISADVFDIRHFEKLRKQYNVMSVPCMVINKDHVSFGKKPIHEVVSEILSVIGEGSLV